MSNLKSKKIGIIGVNGKYGKWLKVFFESRECVIVGSDRDTDVTNEDVVNTSDVVIFAVPIISTISVIESLVVLSRKSQLWMDVTSIKTGAVKSMKLSKAEVVGLHPMCAPPKSNTLKGQVLIVCRERIDAWANWLECFLHETQADIKSSSPEEHDRNMAVVQGLTHMTTIAMATTIRRLNIDVKESTSYTSPVYKIAFSLMGRILSQNPDLYADIQMNNLFMDDVLDALELELKSLRKIVRDKDRSAFIRRFDNDANHFGEENLTSADDLFKALIGFMVEKNT